MHSNFLTIDEAACLMSVSPAWVKGMIENGQLQAEQQGECLLIDASEIADKGWDASPEPVAPPMANLTRMNAIVGVITLH